MRPRRRARPLSVPTTHLRNATHLGTARPTVAPGVFSPFTDSEASVSPTTTPPQFARFAVAPTPPPTGPLPAPPFMMKMVAQGSPATPRHEDSVGWDLASTSSSYGDSRELLRMAPVVSGRYRLKRATSSILSGKASSDVLAEGDENADDQSHDQADDANDRHDIGNTRAGKNLITHQHHLSQSGEWSDISNSATGTDQRASQPLTEASAHALQRDLSEEFRGMGDLSHLRGASNVRASIMILTPDGVHFSGSERSSSQKMADQSQESSHLEMRNIHQDNSDQHRSNGTSDEIIYHHAGIPKIWRETGAGRVTETGSFAASIRSSGSKYDDHNDADTDGDWETVAETGAGSRHSSGFHGHKPTGESLAGTSSAGSLSPDHAKYRFPHDPMPMVQHPADPRYEHVYRVRPTVPTGEPVLLPAYNFKGGIGFPNRNALTPPSPSSAVFNPYQPPAPLLRDHAHPFQSSPPVIVRTGRNGSRGYDVLRTLEEVAPFEYGPGLVPAPRNKQGIRLVESSSSEAEALRRFDFGVDSDKRGPNDLSVTGSSSQSNVDDSFAKSFLLGVKRNITGTPRGTGMREVGSSLVADSSSQRNWPGNAYHGPTFTQGHSGMDGSQGSSNSNGTMMSNRLYQSLRAHRQVLAAEGLLPEAIAPVHTRSASDEEFGPDGMHNLGRNSMLTVSPSPTTYLEAFARPFSYNQTPALPRPVSDRFADFDYRLRRLRRDDSSVVTVLAKRKQGISRGILAMCMLFPPLLLLYGHGMLDGIITAVTKGQIEHFGHQEKKVALYVGWTIAMTAMLGMVIGLIVVMA